MPMEFFGQESDQGRQGDAAVVDFWVWWARTRPQVDALLEADDASGAGELLASAVAAVDPGLVAEITPGREALRSLVVSCDGDPELRPLAHRWARAAPPPDALWEFHPSRQASSHPADLVLEVDGREFALGKLVLGLRVPPGAPRMDISAYHPIFPDLGDEDRAAAAFLALDRLIGEDEVARWIGDVTAATAPPIDAVPAIYLPTMVADLAAEHQGEQWALLTGQTAGGAPLVAATRYPLRPVDHPLFDRHIAITLPYAERDADGLPAGDAPEALRAFEERLTTRLGDTALLAVHMSSEGNRVLHVYADPSTDAVQRAEDVAETWTEGTPTVESTPDPGWLVVSPFLT
ncbi:hypothetical protein Skr01_20240 [Sphaerisporangium krabiense]|uniref:DUF695 domain-containing protein n=1 Tax=Sphaerisporangium krabiense TaxID=763782 RepID=A0A7W8Z5S8_9ACTN|nr:DUF695 domain-containing protein [Sphaerisporangium krabiense]MBB5627780.1 hypothetical protein [Sphaerisporangium krabiense]GII61939.1 hypothetical protein Skr01_20240 [Sphaerisporangium krabiense]